MSKSSISVGSSRQARAAVAYLAELISTDKDYNRLGSKSSSMPMGARGAMEQAPSQSFK